MKRLWQQLTHWERWPFNLIYTPMGFLWLYYAVKARAFWFCSNVDPTLEFAGFIGETKREMYEQMPNHLYPATIYIMPNQPIKAVEAQIAAAGIGYPFAVKPQVGMQGMMFRKINSPQQLAAYHRQMIAEYLVQSLVDLPMEFSVFHIRYPGHNKGKITGFILKEYLAVTGDGQSTLLQLIRQHERAAFREEEMRQYHAEQLDCILPAGEKYYLSIAGNHNRGARFINLHHEIDAALCNVFDDISLQCGHFYYGRYDLKCTSVEDLKEGKNIQILEYNGTGAEPNHIYDCGMTYLQALKVIKAHWKDMYRIGKINFKQGIPYWNYSKGRAHMKKSKRFFKMLQQADLTCQL